MQQAQHAEDPLEVVALLFDEDRPEELASAGLLLGVLRVGPLHGEAEGEGLDQLLEIAPAQVLEDVAVEDELRCFGTQPAQAAQDLEAHRLVVFVDEMRQENVRCLLRLEAADRSRDVAPDPVRKGAVPEGLVEVIEGDRPRGQNGLARLGAQAAFGEHG